MPSLELDDEPAPTPSAPSPLGLDLGLDEPPAVKPSPPAARELPSRASAPSPPVPLDDELPEPPPDLPNRPRIKIAAKFNRCPRCTKVLPDSHSSVLWCPACGADLKQDPPLRGDDGPLSPGDEPDPPRNNKCPQCAWPFPSSDRPAPWCPKCGADLKQGAAPAPRPKPVAAAAPAPEHRQAVYFTVRMNGSMGQPLYRVYVLADEVLFMYSGPGNGDHLPQGGANVAGLVGGLIGSAVSAEMRERTKARQRELDTADVAKLRRLVAEVADNFRATATDLTDVRIEAVGFWNSLAVGAECAGVLYLTHRERGSLTLALLTLDDVRIATQELPATLGNAVAVNVVWSDRELKFVKK
jgi:hypothetical protein